MREKSIKVVIKGLVNLSKVKEANRVSKTCIPHVARVILCYYANNKERITDKGLLESHWSHLCLVGLNLTFTQ